MELPNIYEIQSIYSEEELLPVVALLAEQYTSFESTSISYECANHLMQAVKYCISAHLHAGKPQVGVMEAYRSGLGIITEKTGDLLQRYNEFIPYFKDYGNRCLRDTVLKGIPLFLSRYDVRFAPWDTILTLDYPILLSVSNLCGVDAVSYYLSVVETEQHFLSKLPEDYMMRVLDASTIIKWRDRIENITEIILPGVVTHLYLNKRFDNWDYSVDDIRRLNTLFSLDNSELEIRSILQNMVKTHYDGNTKIMELLLYASSDLAIRMKIAASEKRLEGMLIY